MARETMQDRLTGLGEKVQKLRDKGEKWAPIAEAMGVSGGKCMLAYMYVTTPEKDRIKFKTDEDLAPKVVKARENELSWGRIAARSGLPESKIKKIWEQTTGKSSKGERIGKGGRHPSENGQVKTAAPKAKGVAAAKTAKAKASAATAKAEAAKAKAATKAPAKKAPAKKAAAAPKKAKLDILTADTDTLAEALEGRKIKVHSEKTGKDTIFAVRTVKSSDDKNVSIIDAKSSGERTFSRTAIIGVTGR